LRFVRASIRFTSLLLTLTACSSPRPANEAQPPAPPAAKPVSDWVLTPSAFGPVEIGWTVAQLNAALGDSLQPTYEISDQCDQLAPAAFYNWGNAIGDPATSTGFAMFGPSPHSVWDGKDLIDMIGPLWGEKDEAKRIAGYQAVSKYIAENGYVIPLIQYVQPIIYSDKVKVVPSVSGAVLPALMTPA